uniref:H15 domain-containing protein n=1 Tax=Cyprinus carpio TaxID=7962 RepID=A0A8C2DA82_CYPCA
MAETDPAAAVTKAGKKISAAKHKTMGPSKLIVKTVSASKERKGSLVQTKGTGALSSFKLNKKQAETKTKAAPKAKKPTSKKFHKKAKKPAAKKKMKSPLESKENSNSYTVKLFTVNLQ